MGASKDCRETIGSGRAESRRGRVHGFSLVRPNLNNAARRIGKGRKTHKVRDHAHVLAPGIHLESIHLIVAVIRMGN